MASDENLRREILKLSNLIAASNGGTTSTASLNPVYSSARTPTNYLPHHHQYLHPYPYTTSVSTRPPPYQPPRNIRLASYPNPFDGFLLNDTYVNQVFPPNLLEQSSDSKPKVVIKNNSRGRSRAKYFSPYKLDNSKNPKATAAVAPLPSPSPPLPPPPPIIIKQEKLEILEELKKAPASIYINPSYLAQVNSSTGELSLSIQTTNNGIRPHFNPAHSSFHLLKNNCSNNGGTGAIVPNGIHLTKNYKVIETYPTTTTTSLQTLSEATSFKLQQQISCSSSASSTTSSSTSPLRTKYKLDRRLKRSPTRKATKTKLFKQYSMRMVSTAKLNQSIYQSHVRKAQRQLIKKITLKSFMKARTKKIIVIKKGRKSGVVHIDGSKFIRKNGGKSLKRVKSKTNVIDISGHQFIRKNGGKSLKRLSESQQYSSVKWKPLNLTHSQPHQLTPGVRLAKSAVQKSKVTLSQRTWKKKQLCMYYNRFGECKRKDNGSCPYIHDRKQLMICPKFIVGKCSNKECKLSHDLKLGRMPPCQFFNKSECSRENCPYPHIKSLITSPLNKKPAETGGKPSAKITSTPARKRKISLRKDPSKKTPKKKSKDPKSRYYEQAPDSQPIVAIIPRRYRKSSTDQGQEKNQTKSPKESENPSTKISSVVAEPSAAPLVPKPSDTTTPTSSTSTLSTAMADRRSRLMSKISRLHEQMKKKESTAPQFLPFN